MSVKNNYYSHTKVTKQLMKRNGQKPTIYALAIIKNKHEQILFEFRGKQQIFADQYALIGGKVEENESASQALKRELYEELTIIAEKEEIQFAHVMHFRGATQPCIAFFFVIQNWTGEPSTKEKNKTDHLRWFSVNELPEEIIPRHKKALMLIQREISYSEDNWKTDE